MPEARGGGRVYRPGDRVLQLRNDYELEVFNGDLGTVAAIDPTEQEVTMRAAEQINVEPPPAPTNSCVGVAVPSQLSASFLKCGRHRRA